jgi:hypothetical protein
MCKTGAKKKTMCTAFLRGFSEKSEKNALQYLQG